MCPSIFIDISFYQGYCPKTLFLFDNIQKPQWDLASPLATPGLKSTSFSSFIQYEVYKKTAELFFCRVKNIFRYFNIGLSEL